MSEALVERVLHAVEQIPAGRCHISQHRADLARLADDYTRATADL